ncbi:MAG TPA: hypothetical protein VGG06_04950 [Thermoanaerobaculia bacterium]|jgi:hypothetical protein
MKKTWTFLLLCALTAPPLLAGVVFEVETKDHGASPPRVETHQMSAEGRLLKMEVDSGGRGSKGEVIFRGDRREMVIVDHDEKSFFVMDEEGVREMAAQIGAAMSQIEEALKNVPEGQRAMVEEMMKKRMPQAAAGPVTKVRKTGERADQAGYPCVKYEVLRDDNVVTELWVTDWDNVKGGGEVAGVFKDMAGFFDDMMKAFASASGPMGGFVSDLGSAVVHHMSQIDGFPVVSRQLDGGRVENESTLRSAESRAIGPGDFEPPAGYQRRELTRP